MQDQGKVPGGYTPPALGPVSMETIQETGEILIFADINGLPNLSAMAVPINSAWLQLPILKQVQQEVSCGF